jgi:hypothetical protein
VNVARKLTSRVETYVESGRVERTGAELAVRIDDEVFIAARAKSCLVEPDVGDRVLCAIDGDRVYVLAVLEGAPSPGVAPKTTIATDGDLELIARGGRASITSTEGVDVLSGGEVTVTAAEIHARAPRGTVAVDDLGFFGKLLQAEVAKVVLVASEMDSLVTRVTQKAKRVFRIVEELDQTRAKAVDVRAETILALRGENAVVSARVLTKVDGEQVHIG